MSVQKTEYADVVIYIADQNSMSLWSKMMIKVSAAAPKADIENKERKMLYVRILVSLSVIVVKLR